MSDIRRWVSGAAMLLAAFTPLAYAQGLQPGPRPSGPSIQNPPPATDRTPPRALNPSIISPEAPPAIGQDPAQPCETGRDEDRDTLDDGCEDRLLQRFAPVLFLPTTNDWTKPTSVEWYLNHASLRFHNNNCADEAIAAPGTLTQQSLLQFERRKVKRGILGCDAKNEIVRSRLGEFDRDHLFFFQFRNDVHHRGSANPQDWVVYGHVYPNRIGGMNLQYWFMYAYNDNAATFNHEGDWESMIVRLRANRSVDGVFFCQHGDCSAFKTPTQMDWLMGRPIGYVADGSHATYWSKVACDTASTFAEGPRTQPNCSDQPSVRWFTATGSKGSAAGFQGGGVINVGEVNWPRNGQSFIQFNGLWGEVGSTATTSGPRTPSAQSTWMFDAR